MKKLAALFIFAALQLSCASIGASRFDAVVKPACGKTQQCFEKVQAAIDAAPQIISKLFAFILLPVFIPKK